MPGLYYNGDTETYVLPLTDTLTAKFIVLEPPYFSFLRLLEYGKQIHQEGIAPDLARKIETYCESLNKPIVLAEFADQLLTWNLTRFIAHLPSSDTSSTMSPTR